MRKLIRKAQNKKINKITATTNGLCAHVVRINYKLKALELQARIECAGICAMNSCAMRFCQHNNNPTS